MDAPSSSLLLSSSPASLSARVDEMLSGLADPFDLDRISKNFPVSYEESLNTILRLEAGRYNDLVDCIRSSLEQVRMALRGKVIMSIEIELVFDSIVNNQVPGMWKMVSG
jgi:dynein heavy chain